MVRQLLLSSCSQCLSPSFPYSATLMARRRAQERSVRRGLWQIHPRSSTENVPRHRRRRARLAATAPGARGGRGQRQRGRAASQPQTRSHRRRP
uniref:Uncharacterized protein n=1 Tax=Setaria viridis TaxID=4556 RepID=A0A4U6TSW9_SETVI|nr:hypothetical protein SEVIR_7G119866v2 [Setaria viridis]